MRALPSKIVDVKLIDSVGRKERVGHLQEAKSKEEVQHHLQFNTTTIANDSDLSSYNIVGTTNQNQKNPP